VEASQDASFTEAPQALEARGRREPDELGKVLVRNPSILLQRQHEGGVDSVQRRLHAA
jgi:hypothetical protein